MTIQSRPSSSIRSCTEITAGWFSLPAERASRSARRRASRMSAPSSPNRGWISLIATFRPSRESWARHTVPRPSCPIGEAK